MLAAAGAAGSFFRDAKMCFALGASMVALVQLILGLIYITYLRLCM